MIEWSLTSHVLLPVGLGLLGFVEPCAIGSHMVTLGALAGQSRAKRFACLLLFVVTRTLALGAVGIVVAWVGQSFSIGQKTFWLLFGIAYITLGAVYFAGKAGVLMHRLGVSEQFVGSRRGALALGLVFGLSVPACAAPLLFAVAASATGVKAYALGFMTMALFGLALSAPLLLMAALPKLGTALEAIRAAPRVVRRTIALLLIGAGLWSMWFGLFVEPGDWRMSP